MKDFTFILGYSDNLEKCPDRIRNFQLMWKYFSPHSYGLGLRLFRQTINTLNLVLHPYVSTNLYSIGKFNPGWIFNKAIKEHSPEKYFALCDAGCIMNWDDILNAIGLLERGFEMVNFGKQMMCLDEATTEQLYQAGEFSWEDYVPNTQTYSASPTFFSRKGYQKVGGLLEYPCWGIVDRALSYIAPRLLDSYAMINGRSVHLYHEPHVMNEQERKEWEGYSADAERRRTMSYEELKRDAAERWEKCGL